MDLRRRRTRSRLQAALRSLLSEGPLSAVTVEELTRRAGVTRPTFYSNYSDLSDMLGEYLDGLLAELDRRNAELLERSGECESTRADMARITASIFADLDRDDPRLHALLGGVPGLTPEVRFARMVEGLIDRSVHSGHPAPTREEKVVAAHFFTGAFLGLVRLWASRPEGIDALMLGEAFSNYVYNGRAGGPVTLDHP
ncbi:TetR/AcrR family transcriptional regulator [Histidinibacterium aquaticum]|uniref:TetR/AcrR family transcriptional regulator n=1 Tax=Histidinibacterium aquaticum TaxID=2613962 RepID=A0A5J5GIG7_9RHOB|nr:TetR/AcrR family transcriptional regulator [Histidinibacterium aquaticum]KAA9008026.1 TetR/AcrR family transcriptional regulator [Histidinibacterium aquaticum]